MNQRQAKKILRKHVDCDVGSCFFREASYLAAHEINTRSFMAVTQGRCPVNERWGRWDPWVGPRAATKGEARRGRR